MREVYGEKSEEWFYESDVCILGAKAKGKNLKVLPDQWKLIIPIHGMGTTGLLALKNGTWLVLTNKDGFEKIKNAGSIFSKEEKHSENVRELKYFLENGVD
jgi:hypothetical protein